MISFAKRNLLVFFKDRSSVFFSLLAVFIIIGLYALFLGDAWTNSINVEGGRFLMDSWIGSGLLAVVSVTTTMGAFGIMVEDKTKKIVKDFISSPLKRTNIAGGYILSAYLIGIIMSLITLVLVEIYIIGNGGTLISFSTFIKVLGILILSTFANTSIMLFVVLFFNSNNAFSTASTIIGTIIGFLTGIYLPIGQLPKSMQWVVKLFPPSHSAVLFRQVMMEEPMAVSFAGAPEAVVTEFKEAMGVIYKMGEYEVSELTSILIIAGIGVIFFFLSLLKLSQKKK
ncbi:MAG TPA: ABC transporter permease [Bacilli bacterium]|jgi:multidrug/hemolysin transport system permease protein|nr:ABC transporter permease [Bacilli bacterium]HOD60931.1 ABC transporter permease [Bacilli bacterium]HOH61093.1 ABC transporter permease [Bacilli bacterium]HPB48693.1 ABC transporter permease [Bacilli bacterium]HPM14890.1 ABC transporter permease [Bacilli bacterium]